MNALPTLTATVATPDPARLIRRLCRHFGHRCETQWDAHGGRIRFDGGDCRLGAEGTWLRIELDADEAGRRTLLQQVVTRHLHQVASGETLTVDWQAAA